MARLDDVRDRLLGAYRAALATRAKDLARLASAHRAGDPGAAEAIRRLAHQLAGSGASYGFPDLSAAARVVEDAELPDLPAASAALIDVLHAHAARS